jgi:quinol monooxygenase YgiN
MHEPFLLSWETSARVDLVSGVIAIVAYRSKPGKEVELVDLVRNRVPTLRKEDLVTDRTPTIMRGRDGTIIEVSEWKSREAIDAAHKNPNVLAMSNKFFAICDCIPLKTLAEAEEMFAGFEPL